MSRIESYSSLATGASCWEKYRLAYIERLEAPGFNLPMHMGSAFHAALKVMYIGGWGGAPRILQATSAFLKEWGDLKPPLGGSHTHLTRDFGVARLEAYVKEREAKPTALETSEIVSGFTEELHVFEWSDASGRLVRVRGVPDFAIRDASGCVRPVDTKTTSSWVNEHWAMQFRIGHQLRIYGAMFQNLLGESVSGGHVNVVYVGEKALDEEKAWTKRKSSPTLLINVDFTKEQLEEAHAWVRGNLLMRDTLAASDLEIWPRNEHACGLYSGCEFLSLCSAPTPMARKARMMTNFKRREER